MANAKNFIQFTANQARGYASTVTRLAKSFSESSRVRSTIRSAVERQSDGRYIIRVHAGGPSAPDARAREYGSGVWARRGPKGKILIVPKRAKALVFPWEVATSPVSGQISPNIPRTSDGKVILKQVEHPGIDADQEGRGYIAPAIVATNKFIREKFGTEGKAAIIKDIRASFKGAKRVG